MKHEVHHGGPFLSFYFYFDLALQRKLKMMCASVERIKNASTECFLSDSLSVPLHFTVPPSSPVDDRPWTTVHRTSSASFLKLSPLPLPHSFLPPWTVPLTSSSSSSHDHLHPCAPSASRQAGVGECWRNVLMWCWVDGLSLILSSSHPPSLLCSVGPAQQEGCLHSRHSSPTPSPPLLFYLTISLRSLRSPSISGSRFSCFLTLSVSRSPPSLSLSPSLPPGIRLALPLVGLLAPSPLHLAHSASTFRPSSHPVSLSSLSPSPSIASPMTLHLCDWLQSLIIPCAPPTHFLSFF